MKANRFLLNLTVRVGLAVSLAVPFVAQTGISPVAACSGGAIPLPQERFSGDLSAEYTGIEPRGIALLGQVLDVHELTPPNRYVWHNVRTEVALTDGVTQVVAVGPHGFGGADCSGGPRLFPGEKVMLFMYPSRGVVGGYCRDSFCGDWQSGQFGTPILFEGDSA